MNIPLSTQPIPPAITFEGSSRVSIVDVSWEQYVALGEIFRDRSRIRLSYDRGSLEIMVTSPDHERLKYILSRLVDTLAEEFDVAIAPFGNMTFQSEILARGLEPDSCYWVAHEAQVRAMRSWDPERDPPPDLCLEIEISRSVVSRMGIYSALGVPEVWRCNGERLTAHLRQPDGTYIEFDSSPTFPNLPLAGIIPFLQQSYSLQYLDLIRQFREWVRQQRAAE